MRQDRWEPAEYRGALMASALYAALQGHYPADGKPVDRFEGQSSETQGMVIARFPSLKVTRCFWYLKDFQNSLKLLCEDAGKFDVSVFPDIPPG